MNTFVHTFIYIYIYIYARIRELTSSLKRVGNVIVCVSIEKGNNSNKI